GLRCAQDPAWASSLLSEGAAAPADSSSGLTDSPPSADLLSSSIYFSSVLSTPRQWWIRKFPRSYLTRLSSSPTSPPSISARICSSSARASSKFLGGVWFFLLLVVA